MKLFWGILNFWLDLLFWLSLDLLTCYLHLGCLRSLNSWNHWSWRRSSLFSRSNYLTCRRLFNSLSCSSRYWRFSFLFINLLSVLNWSRNLWVMVRVYKAMSAIIISWRYKQIAVISWAILLTLLHQWCNTRNPADYFSSSWRLIFNCFGLKSTFNPLLLWRF